MPKGGSSRHLVHHRVHLERNADPSKCKFKPQEKKRHFLQRAKVVKRKKEVLRKVRQKAAAANPNEFKFAMRNQKLVRGKLVKLDKQDDALNRKILDALSK